MKRNVNLELINRMNQPAEKGKRILLHSCCAPCSTHVITMLANTYRVTVFYYNPNITIETEYSLRKEEQIQLIQKFNNQTFGYPIEFLEGDYEPDLYFHQIRGNEDQPEGGKRCELCFRMRLLKTAMCAINSDFDCFMTTLTISPLKNSDQINGIGHEIETEVGIKYLPTDFKKGNGYLHSIELSKEYQLYRQDYCGCIYSKAEANIRKMLGEQNEKITR